MKGSRGPRSDRRLPDDHRRVGVYEEFNRKSEGPLHYVHEGLVLKGFVPLFGFVVEGRMRLVGQDKVPRVSEFLQSFVPLGVAVRVSETHLFEPNGVSGNVELCFKGETVYVLQFGVDSRLPDKLGWGGQLFRVGAGVRVGVRAGVRHVSKAVHRVGYEASSEAQTGLVWSRGAILPIGAAAGVATDYLESRVPVRSAGVALSGSDKTHCPEILGAVVIGANEFQGPSIVGNSLEH
jgi:hypothetical protein